MKFTSIPLLALITGALLSSGPIALAIDHNLQTAIDNIASGDHEKSFNIIVSQAASGDVDAKNALAACYASGIGVERDTSRAFLIWRDLEPKSVKARHNLAYAYYKGSGCERDLSKAFELFHKLSNLDGAAPDDMLIVAYMYQLGQGITQSTDRAIYWYKKSSDLDFAPAKVYCATLIYNTYGETASQDAFSLLHDAEKAGDARASYYLGYVYERGLMARPADLEVASEYYKKSASKGLGLAQIQLGHYFFNGTAGVLNRKLAFDYYTKASKMGLVQAKSNLASCYLGGLGVAADLVEFERNAVAACNGGDPDAAIMLGLHYSSIDSAKSLHFYREAYRLGAVVALYRMGDFAYEKGDFTKAITLYDKAHQDASASEVKANSSSYLNAAYCHFKLRQLREACAWASFAEHLGNSEAILVARHFKEKIVFDQTSDGYYFNILSSIKGKESAERDAYFLNKKLPLVIDVDPQSMP